MSADYFAPERFAIVAGAGALLVYRFADHLVNHYFCGRCGVYTFHDTTERPGHYRVNLGCVDGVDPYSLPITMIDGRTF